MATLSQLLGSFSNRKAVYDRLGAPQGAYTGSAAQNNWLLQNQSKWGQASAPAAAAPQDPFANLKNQALSSEMLREVTPYEQVNPFSNFFNEDLVRGSFSQLFKPEQERLTGIAEESYNRNVGNLNRNFDQTVNDTTQTYANNGALFGGARRAGINKVNEDRTRGLGDLLTAKTQDDYNRQREFNRNIEEQVQREKAFKNQQYLDEKNRYLTNPKYK